MKIGQIFSGAVSYLAKGIGAFAKPFYNGIKKMAEPFLKVAKFALDVIYGIFSVPIAVASSVGLFFTKCGAIFCNELTKAFCKTLKIDSKITVFNKVSEECPKLIEKMLRGSVKDSYLARFFLYVSGNIEEMRKSPDPEKAKESESKKTESEKSDNAEKKDKNGIEKKIADSLKGVLSEQKTAANKSEKNVKRVSEEGFNKSSSPSANPKPTSASVASSKSVAQVKK